MKTNAVRVLDQARIAYALAPYEVDEHDLSAETVAAKIGWPVEHVYKTLAARGDKTGVVLAVIATPQTLDLKALAAASGNKKVEMLPLAEVLPTALSVAEKLAAGPQHALRWTKRSLNLWIRDASPIFEASLGYEMLNFFDDDVLEGATAIKEKRAPRFPSVSDG